MTPTLIAIALASLLSFPQQTEKPYVVPSDNSQPPRPGSQQYVIPPPPPAVKKTPAKLPARTATKPASKPIKPAIKPAPKPAITAEKTQPEKHEPIVPLSATNALLWSDPGSIPSRNLFNGPGGASPPTPPFSFLKEDKAAATANSVFSVQDASGRQWRVELAPDTRAQVAASRLMWAVGFFAEQDYFVPAASALGITLSRGQTRIANHSEFKDARFSRVPPDDKQIGIWHWKGSPLSDKREFNGLRVMMAVLNGWDLRDENNAVYLDEKTGRQLYLITGIHPTFGVNGLSLRQARPDGNLGSPKPTRFVTRVSEGTVDLSTPAAPVLPLAGAPSSKPPEDRLRYQWIGRNIPLDDVRWMATLLAKISHQQLTDAFKAANYSPEDLDEYVTVIESRIDELKSL